ncbi:ABC transporter ATP-binding protein [Qipengyuania sp. ASV99]|uniref:ABC transporter ATP-binding protein n=1 Tax=Qipengyuania sp. ASV99 TaxID=3399681 RepID=UPI003A4C6622
MTLSADSLSLNRGGAEVLHGISASLAPGQITAIVGPNGAGKSSLLMALAGLLEASAGKVLLEGEPLSAIPVRRRACAIGYLPQGADIAWDVAAEALVMLGRMPHRDALREPVEAAITALDLSHLRRRPVSTLSGGERARVLLARVLAGEPRWILADEPLAALDLAHQLRLAEHLRGCAARGAGVVIVLHDLALAMNHADRVLVLDRGTLAANAPPPQALSPEVIERVWGVRAQWLIGAGQPNPGQPNPGQHALVTYGRD